MDEKELRRLFTYNEKESKIYMPNEIFDDLIEGISGGSSHIAFAYSYYYLITYLYRYTKYGNVGDFPAPLLKRILCYVTTNKTLDKVIKKNGELDKIGYTRTVKDKLISWIKTDNYLHGDIELTFITASTFEIEYQKYVGNKKNSRYKLPIKAFWREQRSEIDGLLDGTFYSVENTHMIQFEIFLHCMARENLNTGGFYVYSFLKHKNDMFKTGFSCKIEELVSCTGIKKTKLVEILNLLERYNMISNSHEPYVMGLPSGQQVDANTYVTHSYTSFYPEPTKMTKAHRVISYGEYLKMKQDDEQDENPFNKKV